MTESLSLERIYNKYKLPYDIAEKISLNIHKRYYKIVLFELIDNYYNKHPDYINLSIKHQYENVIIQSNPKSDISILYVRETDICYYVIKPHQAPYINTGYINIKNSFKPTEFIYKAVITHDYQDVLYEIEEMAPMECNCGEMLSIKDRLRTNCSFELFTQTCKCAHCESCLIHNIENFYLCPICLEDFDFQREYYEMYN